MTVKLISVFRIDVFSVAANAVDHDLFGLDESPRVAGKRERVLLEILAPNQRPVQITEDLAGFWREHYPAVKKTLSRRYPRHEWR